jgi:alkylhydroperoxidase family enzyme
VRFAVARSEGLAEDQVDLIDDGYGDSNLSARDKATLTLTDAIIGDPRSLTPAQRDAIRGELRDPEIVEVALGVGLFMGLSKVLITLGLEPDEMDTTVVETPGSA